MNENQSLDPLRNGMGGVRLERYSTDTFYGLNFTDSDDDVIETRKLDSTPNIVISNGDVIFDYSSVRDLNDISEFRSLFTGKKSNSQFTIKNANYENTILGIEADFNGTYSFKRFLGDSKILATPDSGITYSPDVKVYKSNFFNQIPFIGITLEPTGRVTSYKITNKMGIDSSESFYAAGIVKDDYIKISAATGGFDKNRLFKVTDVFVEEDGTEVITVNKKFPQNDLTGSPITLSTFKTKSSLQSMGTLCFYANETLLNPTTSGFIEEGSLVECKNGSRAYGHALARRNNFSFRFVDEETENLNDKPFNSSSCSLCPGSGITERQDNSTSQSYGTSSRQSGNIDFAPTTFETSQKPLTFSSASVSARTGDLGDADRINESLRGEYDRNVFVITTDETFEVNYSRKYLLDVSHPSLSGFKILVTDIESKGTIGITRTGKAGEANSKIFLSIPRDTKQIRVTLSSEYGRQYDTGPFAVFGRDVDRGLPQGFYYPVYTSLSDVNGEIDNSFEKEYAYHEHKLVEYPNVIFYMPNFQMNHGVENYQSELRIYTDENEPKESFINTFKTYSSASLSNCANTTFNVQDCYRCASGLNDGSDPCAHAIRIARCYYKYADGTAPSCSDVVKYCSLISSGTPESRCYSSEINTNQTSSGGDGGVSSGY